VINAAIRSPERLYGREAEQLSVRAAVADPAVRAVVASGVAGVGKTALIADAMARAASEGALTGAGKHTQGEGGEDLFPFIEALEQAVAAGLDQLYDPEAGTEGLSHALGALAGVFESFGTGLLRSLKAPPMVQTESADAADERVVRACIATLRWLEGFGQPVMLQIDDWGRAGQRATRLYERLIGEPDLRSFHILASERLDEASPLSSDARCRRIPLGPIGLDARREIVTDLLGGAAIDAGSLLDFIGPGTERPFDLIQSVRSLAAGGGLISHGDRWTLDPAMPVRAAVGVPENVTVGLISRHPAQLAMAQALALLGDMADVDDLLAATVDTTQAPVDTLLALELSGLVRRQGRRLSLNHDRLRLAVLETLDPDSRRALAARLAEALRRRGAMPGQDPRASVMLRRRLEAGLDGIDAPQWGLLFQRGALSARQVGDQNAADSFAEAAMALAEQGVGLSHAVLKEGVFAAVERSDHALAIRRADQMSAVATDAETLAESDELRVFARRTAGDLAGAIDVAREALGRAGVKIPVRPSLLDVARSVIGILLVSPKWAARQKPFTDRELAVAAPMMRATNATGSMLFERDPWMAAILASRSIPPRMAAGTSAGAGAYAYICSSAGLYRRAAQWAVISDLRQSPNQPLRAVGKQYARTFGHLFVQPQNTVLAAIDEAERLAYGEGDMAAAAYANQDRIRESLMADAHLDQTIALSRGGQAVSARFRDTSTNHPDAAMRQVAVNLRYGGGAPWLLAGEFFQPEALEDLSARGLTNAIRLIVTLEAVLAVSYGAYETAAAVHKRWAGHFKAAPFQAWTAVWTFITGLALYRTGGRPSAFAVWNMHRLERLKPADKAHRTLLLRAEAARLARRPRRAMALYRQSVEAARGATSLIEIGITAAAASEGAAMLGRPEAAAFADAALEAWTALGAEGVISARRSAPAPSDDMSGLRAEIRRLEARQEERERELETARLAAERANRAKSRFLATIGHELRTPLQGLVGLVDLARETGEDLDVATLQSVVGHFKAVVNDLTDLGALEGGVFPLAQQPYDPADICRGVVTLMEPSLRSSGRSITFAGPVEHQIIQGDEVRVRQIVSNLIGNAIKHTSGDIAVQLGLGPAGHSASVTISVTDEGPGLDPNALVRLFEPFERGLDSEKTEGLGLGLPLARALARRMGGDIVVSPTGARGTCFSLQFDAQTAEALETKTAAPLRGLRVLLAEDAPLSRRVISALLRAQGCTVEEAGDGQAALDHWRAADFDLVLLDLRMPVLDGLSVALTIRHEEGAGDKRQVIVVATAATSPELELAAEGLGLTAVLQKPVGWRDIAQLVGRLSDKDPASMPAKVAMVARDQDILADMRKALGDDAESIFAEARWSATELAARLRSLAECGDPKVIEAEAHRLAGLASTFGLYDLASAALMLESEARAGTITLDRIAVFERAAQSAC